LIIIKRWDIHNQFTGKPYFLGVSARFFTRFKSGVGMGACFTTGIRLGLGGLVGSAPSILGRELERYHKRGQEKGGGSAPDFGEDPDS